MRRTELPDLTSFLVVAEEQNFTRAAAKLGISQSALSHAVRRLETGLGVRLLTRTTRSVVPTQAGDKLLATLVPALASINAELASIGELQEKPAGSIRITTTELAANTVLVPALAKLLPEYPCINVEISIDNGLTDIVTERFDAGVRIGEALAHDMIATRIGPDLRMAVVGAPSYFATRDRPETPQDLALHQCLNLQLETSGGFYAWEFEKDGRELRVRVEGQLAMNNASALLNASMAGLGLACMLEDQVADAVADGRLVRVLDDWCPPFPGFHLYYPSRRQPSAAFTLLVDALRYRGRRQVGMAASETGGWYGRHMF